MPGKPHYERLEQLYHQAPISILYRATIRIERAHAEVIVPVDERFFHGANALHGSVYFRALDDAAFFAANSVVEDVLVLTTSFHVQFLRPVTTGSIRAVGTLINQAGRLLAAEAKLYDDADRLVASGAGSFMKSSIALDSLESAVRER